MLFAIVPVKDLSKAKERLSSLLPQDVRTELACAMLEDVLSALKGATRIDRSFIVTMDRKAIRIAGEIGIEVIEETEQKGESDSVDRASLACKEMGADSVLVIPGDAPLIRPEDIDFVAGKVSSSPSVILVPARDKMGTNAILRTPPDAIPSRFGHDSFRKHIEEAGKKGISIEYYENERVGLDIDHPDDLKLFASKESDTRTYRLLVGKNILGKIRA
ncbi:MAG TPA: 2-phospho-L-lactate guanylyltransferase [Thermodesulfobacteriota bacterium]|nr:2-phospho-L-lactate guanylyltransferase [Thermodesulfobacteriota bacterium]